MLRSLVEVLKSHKRSKAKHAKVETWLEQKENKQKINRKREKLKKKPEKKRRRIKSSALNISENYKKIGALG